MFSAARTMAPRICAVQVASRAAAVCAAKPTAIAARSQLVAVGDDGGGGVAGPEAGDVDENGRVRGGGGNGPGELDGERGDADGDAGGDGEVVGEGPPDDAGDGDELHGGGGGAGAGDLETGEVGGFAGHAGEGGGDGGGAAGGGRVGHVDGGGNQGGGAEGVEGGLGPGEDLHVDGVAGGPVDGEGGGGEVDDGGREGREGLDGGAASGGGQLGRAARDGHGARREVLHGDRAVGDGVVAGPGAAGADGGELGGQDLVEDEAPGGGDELGQGLVGPLEHHEQIGLALELVGAVPGVMRGAHRPLGVGGGRWSGGRPGDRGRRRRPGRRR